MQGASITALYFIIVVIFVVVVVAADMNFYEMSCKAATSDLVMVLLVMTPDFV